MTPRPEWRERLLPYAKMYADFNQELELRIGQLKHRELEELLDATEEPTSSNCWWATYWVAREVREAAGHELRMRRRAKTAEGVGA